MNYYNEIKNELINNEVYKKVKDYSKNRSDLKTYYNVGKLLSEAGKHYGEGIIKKYSVKLTNELGKGFTYVSTEYSIKIGNRYNYIDLLLFNYIDNCFVVVELKITEFKAEYVGQVLKYINYIDKNIKDVNQSPTLGIIICKKNNRYIIQYVTNKNIIEREYKLIV